MSADAPSPGQLPPAGWIYNPSTTQTRWWDGARWTEHVLPAQPPAGYGAVFGSDSSHRGARTSKNGPAKASLILILVQLLGGLVLFGVGIAAGAAGAPIWKFVGLLSLLSMLGFLMTIAAFVLAIVGTMIAVRRPTRKREAVFALVFTSLLIVWMLVRIVASIATYGTL